MRLQPWLVQSGGGAGAPAPRSTVSMWGGARGDPPGQPQSPGGICAHHRYGRGLAPDLPPPAPPPGLLRTSHFSPPRPAASLQVRAPLSQGSRWSRPPSTASGHGGRRDHGSPEPAGQTPGPPESPPGPPATTGMSSPQPPRQDEAPVTPHPQRCPPASSSLGPQDATQAPLPPRPGKPGCWAVEKLGLTVGI